MYEWKVVPEKAEGNAFPSNSVCPSSSAFNKKMQFHVNCLFAAVILETGLLKVGLS